MGHCHPGAAALYTWVGALNDYPLTISGAVLRPTPG